MRRIECAVCHHMASRMVAQSILIYHDESLKAYLAPTGLVSEPRGDLTCRGVEEPWKLYVLYEPECVGG